VPAAFLLVLAVAGLIVWRAELFTVSRPGDRPRPLARVTHPTLPSFAVTLPRVPVGAMPVASGRAAWLVHYWAPWERHGRAQAVALDSLVRSLPEARDGRLRVAIVCFDPFPSVARFVARLHLTVPVLLDHRRELQKSLPCPSVPYTWVFDAHGRVIAAQPGEVDWHASATRALLREVAGRSSPAPGPAVRRERTTPRRWTPPGRRETGRDQPRAVAAAGRASQRESSAWPPNRTAL
jgi:hypothetical protein